MTNEVKNVPQLRFPNFDGEWEEKQLGDVTKTNQGLQIAISDRKTKYEKGLYFYITNEFLRPNSQTKYYIENPPESVVAEKSDILMTRTGNTGKVITNVEGAFHNNFFKIKYNKSIIDRLFLFELLKSPKINNKFLSLAGTSTIPDLNHSDFYSVYISFPTISEQQKISTFFSKLDQQIELEEQKLEKLEEQKKGYMQKIFSQEIRFKDDNGNDYPEWESKKFLDIFKLAPSKNNQIKSSEVVENGIIPVVDQGKDIFLGYSNEKDKAIEDFDNVIVYGDHTTIIKYIKEPFIIGGDGVKLLESNDGSLIHYLYILLQYFNVKPEGYKRHYSILKNKMMNISNTKEEQEKIGDFFNELDELIEKQSSKIVVLKQRKKGFLQKMFV